MGAFKCDSCFHNQVCTDEPNTRALNEECALYANVKNFTDAQQLKAEIAARLSKVDGFPKYNIPGPVQGFIDAMRQLSAV